MIRIICCSFILLMYNCNKKSENTQNKYPNSIGDISFDATVDNPNFVICNGDDNTYQYFNSGKGLEYQGGKITLAKTFKEAYIPVESNENGLVRIRFIVNCKGVSGRFRIIQMDNDYKEKKFDNKIINQLVKITKNLSGWKIKKRNGKEIDYYQYLIFKIEKGNLIEVLP